MAADAVLLVVAMFAIGAIISWVRFRTAQVPAITATRDLGIWALLLTGLRWFALMAVLFALLGAIAYALAARKWEQHGPDWHRLVVRKGVSREGGEVRAPLGEVAVRILAGFNIGVLSAALTTIAVTAVARILIDRVWLTVPLAIALFAGCYLTLTNWGPLKVGPRIHATVWTAVAAAGALLATLPLGVLVLIGVGISTFGRTVARSELPRKPSMFLRSPLPWMMVALYTAVGIAYYAVPPVSFERDLVFTQSGEQVGGYLARMDSGTRIVTCQALADATAYNPRITFVPAARVLRSKLGGAAFYVDSGDRPSLATLAMRRLGISIRLPVPLGTGLRASEPTCDGTGPRTLAHGFEDPALGAGVIASGAPLGGRANDGESPVEQTTPGIAALARKLQPTLEVSVADRDWPVSVGALLADRGPAGQVTCLHEKRSSHPVCPAGLGTLSRSEGDSGDYLQYPTPQATSVSPSPLNGEPEVEFQPFEAGQGVVTGSLHHWLADPGVLDPWASAEIYFVDAGVVPSNFPGWPVRDPQVPPGLLDLEYWFFYQYNYFPTLFDRHLMGAAPLKGDLVNTDLHQGDWEHVDVLIAPLTHRPEWLYLARHSNEGVFERWGSAAVPLDGTHPIIQAAFGGHPSYTGCGQQHRRTPVPLSDWVVCGYGRFAFRGATTPLVDLRAASWGCWRGHFGYAGPDTISSANESFLDRASTSYYRVAGPPTPLRQAENSKLGLCP